MCPGVLHHVCLPQQCHACYLTPEAAPAGLAKGPALAHAPVKCDLPTVPKCEGLCRSWVLVSWIWSLLWHMPLDLIKWAMAYVLNEDGFRQRIHGKKPTNIATETAEVDLPSQARSLPCLFMYIYTLPAGRVGYW